MLLANLADTPDLTNRLFFSSRNLAIEALLLRLEVLLLREGFPAKCEWHETSFGGPSLFIRMLNPKPTPSSWEHGTCTLSLARETVPAPVDVSSCVYSVSGFSESEDWHGRQPALLLAFRQRVRRLHDEGYLAEEVNRVNYPFDYESHSSV